MSEQPQHDPSALLVQAIGQCAVALQAAAAALGAAAMLLGATGEMPEPETPAVAETPKATPVPAPRPAPREDDAFVVLGGKRAGKQG